MVKKILRLISFFFVLLTLSLAAPFTKAMARDLQGEFLTNYDGDTMTVKILTQNDPLFGTSEPVRLKSIDTPEIRGKCPEEKELAQQGRIRLNQLCYNKPVLLKNVGRDKYNRLLADVYCGEKDVAGILLKEKLALPYSGRTKRPDWCEHLKSKKTFFFNF